MHFQRPCSTAGKTPALSVRVASTMRAVPISLTAFAVLLLSFLSSLTFPSPARAQSPVSGRDPLWVQQAEGHWYDEQVAGGRPPTNLLFGLEERGGMDGNGTGSFGMSSLFEMYHLFGLAPGSDDIELTAFAHKALTALPLLRSGNGLELLFRPQGDIYATYARRFAERRLEELSHIELPTGAVAVDLHVHTCYSHDSLADPVDMLRAGARRGLSGMAITDHDTMEGARKALEALPRLVRDGKLPQNFFVIPGEEVSTLEGHVIGLFLTHEVPAGMGAERTVAMIHAQGGIAIAPHPELPDGLGTLANTLPFDAVETENAAEQLHFAMSSHSSRGEAKRAQFYAAVSRPRVGVSDAHDPAVVATSYTLLRDCAATPEAVRAALLAGKTEPVACLDNEQERHTIRRGLPRLLYTLGSAFGSDSSGLGAWLKDHTGADMARVTLLPHPTILWTKRF